VLSSRRKIKGGLGLLQQASLQGRKGEPGEVPGGSDPGIAPAVLPLLGEPPCQSVQRKR